MCPLSTFPSGIKALRVNSKIWTVGVESLERKNIALNMNCMEGVKRFPDKYFDLAVVDPEYGININHNMGRRKGEKPSPFKKVKWDKEPPQQEYFNELFRVSKNQIIFGGNYFTDKLPPSKCWICWDKGFSDEVSFASFELAWTSFDRAAKRILISSVQKNRIHPTQKPVRLYERIFKNYAKDGYKILDTHLGSGSSRIAAYNYGLTFIGYEIDKDYFDLQEERFFQHSAQMSFMDLAEKE